MPLSVQEDVDGIRLALFGKRILQASHVLLDEGLNLFQSPIRCQLTDLDLRALGRLIGFIGAPRVNVLALNRQLDAMSATTPK